MISFKISSYEEYEPYRDTYDDSTYCCFCHKIFRESNIKQPIWYRLQSKKPAFIVVCNEACGNLWILKMEYIK